MKVILNEDVSPLGEEGDVKDVARGYARNYLFPRGLALPYNEKTLKLFESRQEEIEAKKEAKRADAASLKEKLEALELTIVVPAGASGRLYGAVSNQTVSEELAKLGYEIERKRIEVPNNAIKSVGKFKASIKLYEAASAEITVDVEAEPVKEEKKAERPQRERRQREPGEYRTRVAVNADVEAAAAEFEAEAAAAAAALAGTEADGVQEEVASSTEDMVAEEESGTTED